MPRGSVPYRQQGFTLLEIMISTSILAMAVLGATYAFVAQRKAAQGMALQGVAQQIMYQIASSVEANPKLYPYLLSSADNPITYVGCYADSGQPVANRVTQAVGFYGVDLGQIPASNGSASSAFYQPAPAPGGGLVCPQNQGSGSGTMVANYLPAGIEVHVSRLLGSTGSLSYGQVRIHVMILNNGAAGTTNNSGTTTNNRGFFAPTTNFDTTVDVSMAASGSGGLPSVPTTNISL